MSEAKKIAVFSSFEESENAQLEEFARMTIEERFEYLAFLQKMTFGKEVVDVDEDENQKFIVLERKK